MWFSSCHTGYASCLSFDMGLMCWLRVADDCFPASNFASSFNLGSIHGGELATLQVDVRKFLARKPGWSRVTDDGVQTRAHLEAQVSSALALESAKEYRQCLLSHIRVLAREGDETRLREVCESFLGPPAGMVAAASSDPRNHTWDPHVLGMRKHNLLREDIFPAMGSNLKVQRLLNEFLDLLSEYETDDGREQKDLAQATSKPETTEDKKDTDPPLADKKDTDPPLADKKDTDPPLADPPATNSPTV